MPDKPRNVGASVRQRLLNLARARGQPLELLLTRYALERLLQLHTGFAGLCQKHGVALTTGACFGCRR